MIRVWSSDLISLLIAANQNHLASNSQFRLHGELLNWRNTFSFLATDSRHLSNDSPTSHTHNYPEHCSQRLRTKRSIGIALLLIFRWFKHDRWFTKLRKLAGRRIVWSSKVDFGPSRAAQTEVSKCRELAPVCVWVRFPICGFPANALISCQSVRIDFKVSLKFRLQRESRFINRVTRFEWDGHWALRAGTVRRNSLCRVPAMHREKASLPSKFDHTTSLLWSICHSEWHSSWFIPKIGEPPNFQAHQRRLSIRTQNLDFVSVRREDRLSSENLKMENSQSDDVPRSDWKFQFESEFSNVYNV